MMACKINFIGHLKILSLLQQFRNMHPAAGASRLFDTSVISCTHHMLQLASIFIPVYSTNIQYQYTVYSTSVQYTVPVYSLLLSVNGIIHSFTLTLLHTPFTPRFLFLNALRHFLIAYVVCSKVHWLF